MREVLPRFTRRGLLPPGVHRASLAEVLSRFGKGSHQREIVTQRLQRILALAGRGGWLRRAFLFGNYVTAKAQPNDIDVMLLMASGFRPHRCDAEMLKVFDGRLAQDELGATILWISEEMPADLLGAFVDYWQVGREGIHRGIVEVIL